MDRRQAAGRRHPGGRVRGALIASRLKFRGPRPDKMNMRSILLRLSVTAFLSAAGLLVAAPAAAQGFGIGARMAWIRTDVDADADSVRFTGGQIRLGLSPRLGVELSLDRHSESFELLNEKVTETPIQASLLMRLAGGSFSPYLLGGPGWYSRKVEVIDGSDLRSAPASSAGTQAAASRSGWASTSASTATIVTPSSTSATTRR